MESGKDVTGTQVILKVHPAFWRGSTDRALGSLLISAGAVFWFLREWPWTQWAPAALMLAAAALLAWGKLESSCTSLTLDTRRLRYKTGVLARRGNDVGLLQIRSISVHQSIWQRLVGVGTLLIHTAGDEPEIAVASVPRPEDTRKAIQEAVDRMRWDTSQRTE